MPPGTMTVAGNLAFQSGAPYLVQVNPASSVNVVAGGSATLSGTVQAAFASGAYISRTYTILSAAGSLNDTAFNALTTSNLPAGFTASLSCTATDAILSLTATLEQPSGPGGPGALGGLSGNQTNVASALNNFFNSGGALPPNFVTIFGLTGGNLANALTSLSGEAATGSQQVAFQLKNPFLGIMLDPFVDGRVGLAGAGGPALGFAPEREDELRPALERVGGGLLRFEPHDRRPGRGGQPRFALGYTARTASDTRSELGARFDRLLLLNPEAASDARDFWRVSLNFGRWPRGGTRPAHRRNRADAFARNGDGLPMTISWWCLLHGEYGVGPPG